MKPIAATSEFPASQVPNPESRHFSWPLRVYWEDTDAGGVVYHASYLRFFERARSEWLRAAGIGQQQLRDEAGIVFVVHRLEIDFRQPARLDDVLNATVLPENLRSASFIASQQLWREPDRSLLVEARVRIACLDAATFRPRPVPKNILEEIAKP
ncbi:MAG: tol-pal system-associated acyl-CoA thioesterase [Dokdonella sp.]